MLRGSSSAETASAKPHWTQTPEGKARMSKLMKKAHKAKKGPWKPKMDKKEYNRAAKQVTPTMNQYVLARRLERLIRDEVRATGELTDLITTAHALCRVILG